MDSGLYKWYSGLTPTGKTVLVIGSAVMVTIVGYAVVKSINNKVALAKSQQEISGFVSDLGSLNTQGIAPSFQQSQYQQWADSIQEAFSGCDGSLNYQAYSDSGQVVANIITNFKNDADFLALQAAFGIRTISKHWWCGGDDSNVTLSAAVDDQLNTDEVAALNVTLVGLGVTYKF